jgi:hypothetical protein
VQLCIVHPVRPSLNFLPWKLGKAEGAVQAISVTVAEARQHLEELQGKWKAHSQCQPAMADGCASRRFSTTRPTSGEPSIAPTASNR